MRIKCETLLSRLRSELIAQEETLAKLQALSQEYDVMKHRFEERLLLQQEALTAHNEKGMKHYPASPIQHHLTIFLE